MSNGDDCAKKEMGYLERCLNLTCQIESSVSRIEEIVDDPRPTTEDKGETTATQSILSKASILVGGLEELNKRLSDLRGQIEQV